MVSHSTFCLANENKSSSNNCSLIDAGVHALECKVIKVYIRKVLVSKTQFGTDCITQSFYGIAFLVTIHTFFSRLYKGKFKVEPRPSKSPFSIRLC